MHVNIHICILLAAHSIIENINLVSIGLIGTIAQKNNNMNVSDCNV
jgi:hypothetical protein